MIDDQNILPWRHANYPMLATAREGGKEYVVWEQESLRQPGRLVYTAAQRTNVDRRIKFHQRVTEIATYEEAFFMAQQWAWAAKAV